MLYANSPRRQIENVIASNASFMEFSYEKSKFISLMSFKGSKVPPLSEPERWIQMMTTVITRGETRAVDPDGPLCFLHPAAQWGAYQIGWGSTSRDTQRGIASIINTIKSDPLFPRDITDEGIMRILFSPEIAEDVNVLPNALMAIGCTEDTVARVLSMFSDPAVNAVLLQYISGSFSLNTPMYQMLNRSNANTRRMIKDWSMNKESKTATPAMFAYSNFLTWAFGYAVHVQYTTTAESAKLVTQVEPTNLIPYVPVLEKERMRAETRAPITTPYVW